MFTGNFYGDTRRGVVIITSAQLQWTKPELLFSACSNPACGMSEICDGEDLWQLSRLEIKLHAFCRSSIAQKQFIIIIISIIIITFYGFAREPRNLRKSLFTQLMRDNSSSYILHFYLPPYIKDTRKFLNKYPSYTIIK